MQIEVKLCIRAADDSGAAVRGATVTDIYSTGDNPGFTNPDALRALNRTLNDLQFVTSWFLSDREPSPLLKRVSRSVITEATTNG